MLQLYGGGCDNSLKFHTRVQDGCKVVEMDFNFCMKHNKEYAFAVKRGEDAKDQMVFSCGDKSVHNAWVEFLQKRCEPELDVSS